MGLVHRSKRPPVSDGAKKGAVFSVVSRGVAKILPSARPTTPTLRQRIRHSQHKLEAVLLEPRRRVIQIVIRRRKGCGELLPHRHHQPHARIRRVRIRIIERRQHVRHLRQDNRARQLPRIVLPNRRADQVLVVRSDLEALPFIYCQPCRPFTSSSCTAFLIAVHPTPPPYTCCRSSP